jgi:hypothetical protein
MAKMNISAKPVLKFLRELSVIVAGIAISVGIGLWINNVSIEKELNMHLSIVKMELEENSIKLDRYAKWMDKSVRYSNYLRSTNKNSLNKDSLHYYAISRSLYNTNDDFADGDGCGYLNINSSSDLFTTYSFESFKSSGLMRHINDKELLSSIWKAYNRIDYIKNFADKCFQIKQDEAIKELQLNAEGKLVTVPMQVFYNTDLPEAIVIHCINASADIKKTIAVLEDSKKN